MNVSELMVRIGADMGPLQKAFADINKQMRPLAQSLNRAGKSLTKNLTLPIMGAAAGLLLAANRTAQYADEIDKMAIRTGISRRQLQELRYVTDQVGVSFESVQSVIESFTRRLPQMEAGTGESARAIKKMGVEIRDAEGNMRSMDALFNEALLSLSRMQNETERNAMATQIFGRRFFEIVPLLEKGEDAIQELTARAHELGLVMSDEGVASAVDYKDAMSELRQVFQAATRNIVMQFIPILKNEIIPLIQYKLIPLFMNFIGKITSLAEKYSELTDGKKAFTAAVIGFTVAAGPAMLALEKMLKLVTALRVGVILLAKPFVALPAALATVTYGVTRWSNSLAKTESQVRETGEEVSEFNDILEHYGWDVETATRKGEELNEQLKGTADVMSGTGRGFSEFSEEIKRLTDKYTDLIDSSEPLIGARLREAQIIRAKLVLLQKEIELRERLTEAVQKATVTGLELFEIFQDIPTVLEGIEIASGRAAESFEAWKTIFADMALSMRDALEGGMQMFAMWASHGKRSMRDFAQAFRNMTTQIISMEIAKGVMAYARSALQTVPFPFGLLAAGVAAGAASSMLQSIIPSFGAGAFVKGDTLAVVGDHPQGEYIVPAPDFHNIINMGGRGETLEAIVTGDQLRFVLERNYRKRFDTI